MFHAEEVFSIGLNRAVTLIADKAAGKGRGRPQAEVLKALGEHPSEGGKIEVLSGRYGPYVKHGKVNATLPKGVEPNAVTLDQAVQLIAERAAKGPAKKGRFARRRPRRRPGPRNLPRAARRKKPRRWRPRARTRSALAKPPSKSKGKPKRAGLPTQQEITTFLETAEGKVGKREIARAFNVKGNDKIGLKALLKEMAQAGSPCVAARRCADRECCLPSPSSRSPDTTAMGSSTVSPSTGSPTMKAPRPRCSSPMTGRATSGSGRPAPATG